MCLGSRADSIGFFRSATIADLSETISSLFVECLSSFGSLIIALSSERCRAVHLEQVLPVQMFEEYGRFKIWGDQTKAELPPLARGSLDDTLRRDTELRDLVHGILKRLRAVLSRGGLATHSNTEIESSVPNVLQRRISLQERSTRGQDRTMTLSAASAPIRT